MLPRYRGWCSATFSGAIFFGWTPTGRKRSFSGVLAVSGPGALGEVPGPGRKQKNAISRCWGPKTEKKVTTLSGMVVSKFLTAYVLTDRTPTGGKTQKNEDFGTFWPRTAVGP